MVVYEYYKTDILLSHSWTPLSRMHSMDSRSTDGVHYSGTEKGLTSLNLDDYSLCYTVLRRRTDGVVIAVSFRIDRDNVGYSFA